MLVKVCNLCRKVKKKKEKETFVRVVTYKEDNTKIKGYDLCASCHQNLIDTINVNISEMEMLDVDNAEEHESVEKE